ncbi:MAG: SDR family NAD(P)-dependent oxidoreductase [Syntrophobacteraceae bacterium]|jgi:short-subunit dehydrogenase
MTKTGSFPENHKRTAVIIGASSGIGRALAGELSREGWQIALAARRVDLLENIAADCGPGTLVRHVDLMESEKAAAAIKALLDELGTVDLFVISAGTGHINPELEWGPERDTLLVNVTGFASIAQAAMQHFFRQGHGHLVGISSIAALRGSGIGAAYAASKAFQATYLDGLRDLARRRKIPITVTEAQPGFVDTPMMKAARPFWVASPEVAALQILRAVRRRAKHAYITRRWAIVAWLLKLLPRPG